MAARDALNAVDDCEPELGRRRWCQWQVMVVMIRFGESTEELLCQCTLPRSFGAIKHNVLTGRSRWLESISTTAASRWRHRAKGKSLHGLESPAHVPVAHDTGRSGGALKAALGRAVARGGPYCPRAVKWLRSRAGGCCRVSTARVRRVSQLSRYFRTSTSRGGCQRGCRT